MASKPSRSAFLFTDASLQKLRPDKDQRRRVRDLGSQSLFLEIASSGRKTFLMRFSTPAGRMAKLALGPFDPDAEIEGTPRIGMPLTLRAARLLAAEIHRQRSLGTDVVANHLAAKHRQKLKIEQTLKENFATASKRFVEEHAKKRLRGWREIARQLGWNYPVGDGEPELVERGLSQRWADKPLREIDGADIWTVCEEAKRIGTPGMGSRGEASENRARHFRNALSAVFAWGVRQRLCESNPVRSVAAPPLPQSRDRVLSADELRWLWKAAPAAGTAFEAALKILALTGQRRDEIASATREELRDGALYLSRERTKNRRGHVVPLCKTALALFEREEEGKTGEFVFSTNAGRSPISGFSKVKRRLDQKMLDLARAERGEDFAIKPWTLHDIRRTVVTHMAELGIRPDIIEQTINHISGSRGGVAGVYNRSIMLPERRAALERWENHLLSLVEQRPSNVVRLRGNAKLNES